MRFSSALWPKIVIRMPYNRQRQQTQVATDRVTVWQEKVLLGLLFVSLVVPLIYIFTDWFAFADYTLPSWAGIAGVLLLLLLWLFWRSHADLGRNWSPSCVHGKSHLDHQGHLPVDPSSDVRIAMGVCDRPTPVPNWIAGPATILVFAPFLLFSVLTRRANDERTVWRRLPRDMAHRAHSLKVEELKNIHD